MSTPLTVFSDYACPWCYLGFARLESVLESLPEDQTPELRWVHFPLSPDTPPEGRDLASYLRQKGIPVEAATQRLAQICAAEDLAYPTELEGRRVHNTQRAQELAIWAAERCSPETLRHLHRELFAAYHVDNRDLYDTEVLVDIAARVGLDPEAAHAALAGDHYAKLRREQWSTAMEAGVRGVPTFVVDRRAVVGAQPKETLRELLAG